MTFSTGDRCMAHAVIGGEEITKPCTVLLADARMIEVRSLSGQRQTFPPTGVIGEPGHTGHVWLTPVDLVEESHGPR